MVKRLTRLLVVFIILILNVSPLMAASYQEVTVVAVPRVTGSITGFTITYISETQLDLSWGFDGDAVNIMIRAKYGDYPDDIPDEDTAPSDGYLVYYGSGTSVSDTSMNFDENAGMLYYRAWAQKADGKWHTDTSDGSQESLIMTLLFFIALVGILTFVAARSSYWILKFLAGLSWWGVAAYWRENLPTAITEGSATDTIILMIFIFSGLAMFLMPFWFTRKEKSGEETGHGFRLPFQRTPEQEELARRPNRGERNEAYKSRVNDAINGRRTPRRY